MHSDAQTPRPHAGDIDPQRRRLLSALMLSPLLAASPAWAIPAAPRIVVLEWLPLEMLFTLGVAPLAAADTHDYRLWVREPALPPQVIDVGLRSEPNLEYVASLRPELILYSQGYGPRAELLTRIAPVMELAFTDDRRQPLLTARAGLMQLATRLDKVPVAQAHLRALDAQMAAARVQLAAWREQPLLLFTLIDDRHAVILGKSSLFGNVMQQLGIENAWQSEDSFWGTATVGIEQLARLPPLRAICFDHGDAALRQRLSATPLWQALPFVRDGNLRIAPAIWIFGGTLAAGRFCRLLQDLQRSER